MSKVQFIDTTTARDTRFTPLEIQMLLHYYAIAEPYAIRNPDHANSEAVATQRQRLIADGYIEVNEWNNSGYNTTPKGDALIALILDTPEPKQFWGVRR